jgi:membrane associated rhomboid family serine protease
MEQFRILFTLVTTPFQMKIDTGLFVGGIIPLTYPNAYRQYHIVGKWDRTIVTHMFSHSTVEHWALNVSNLVFSALSLDLGFLKSTILFIGSGLAGLGTLYWRRERNPLHRLIPMRVIGSSAAVYGFMGAEICTSIRTLIHRTTRKYNRMEKHNAHIAIAQTMNITIVRVLQIVYQLSMEGDEKYAHLGGFLGGAFLSFIL